ncbi:thiazole tautomerase TenI [Virgibacillus xinjiangensis]|uniref:Thiazole tautomerase TenI n=1 Tax=Virgibacillus xinjiangensis TaxID=393090 RepID=A0ABV7CW80_9BACI
MEQRNDHGMERGELHVISTGRQSSETLASIAEEIHDYVDVFHLREKAWSDREMVEAIEWLLAMGIPPEKIVVNHRIDVAHVTGVKGVQLAHHSIDVSTVRNAFGHLSIGCSVHSVKEAVSASEHGADYLLFGHIYPTSSKPGLAPRGLEGLRQVVRSASVPVIAIGGITPENTRETIQNGASGTAVLSGILLAEDPLEKAIAYKEELRRVAEDEQTI